jgi:hypothetical protein
MTTLTQMRALAAAGLALGCALAGSALAGPAPPDVPSAIQVPSGNKPFLVGHATGVQIYSCTAGGTWSATSTPRATLVGDNGQFIASHFAGPTWQAKDGSRVVGAKDSGVTVAADAIPWLLLHAKSTSPGPDGDRLVTTTFVQRVNTTGGLAPTSGCTAGATTEVPYTADYFFWQATGGGA